MAQMKTPTLGVVLFMTFSLAVIAADAKPRKGAKVSESLAEAVQAARSNPKNERGVRHTWMGLLPGLNKTAAVLWWEPQASLMDFRAVQEEAFATFKAERSRFAGPDPDFMIFVATKTAGIAGAGADASLVFLLQIDSKAQKVSEVEDPELRRKLNALVLPKKND
jgi:hypothetical protein